jgi:hypothetical protein
MKVDRSLELTANNAKEDAKIEVLTTFTESLHIIPDFRYVICG